MALSRVIRTGNGTTTQFVVDFALGYLDQADVTARVGDEVDGAGNPVYRTITFLSDTLLQISGPPAGNGVRVVFERTVEKEDTLVHFSNGDVMDEENLDLSFKQILMVVHEVLDGRFGQFDTDLDMGGFTIKNLGAPVNNSDAANKQYVDGRLGNNEAILVQTLAARDAAQSYAASSSGSAASSATSASNSAAAATASEASRSQAANSATASANSASAAAASAASMSGSVTAAQAARAGAEAARDTALTYRDQAAGHVTSAQSAASAAANSATASETSRQASGTSATASANSASASQTSRLASEAARDTALTYRDQASSSATASAGSASTAATHRDNAYKWSSEAEDIQVDDGVRTGYSAYHWSKKAELASGGGVSSWAGLTGTIDMSQVMDVTRQFRAGTATMPSLNIPHGVAPSSPVNGDTWTTSSGLLVRINGTVSTMWGSHNMGAISQAEAELGSNVQNRAWSSLRVRQNVNAAIGASFNNPMFSGRTWVNEIALAAYNPSNDYRWRWTPDNGGAFYLQSTTDNFASVFTALHFETNGTANFATRVNVAGDLVAYGRLYLGGGVDGQYINGEGNIIFAGVMASVHGVNLSAALLSKQGRPTVSTADPSGGADGDVWFKV